MRPARAVIAGGGIGGLASAIALHRRGWDVRVLEQASAIGEVGAGISLWPNALRALDLLGAGEEVRARGSVDAGAGFRRPDGRWLFRTDFEAFERRFGPTILIHRADLIDILLNALPPEVVTLNARLESARVSTADAVALHGRGEETAELLVGADGIDSTGACSVLARGATTELRRVHHVPVHRAPGRQRAGDQRDLGPRGARRHLPLPRRERLLVLRGERSRGNGGT
jgi:2-polyprenyl-6-methoxyphenol hydroxylase-like FAD-dependent oxidoreductase